MGRTSAVACRCRPRRRPPRRTRRHTGAASATKIGLRQWRRGCPCRRRRTRAALRRWRRRHASRLPALYVAAYADGGGDGTASHARLRARAATADAAADAALRAGMASMAGLVPAVAALWATTPGPGPVAHHQVAGLLARTYALRAAAVGVDARTAALVTAAKAVGLAATLSGSGGAVVCAVAAPRGGAGALSAEEVAAARREFGRLNATFRRVVLLSPGEG